MFQDFMRRPVYRTQCRTWRKAAELALCEAGFRALPEYRPVSALQSRKRVADAIREDRKTGLADYRKRRFFDRAFENDNPPARLRAFAERFCLQGNINGVCDPMYICNVVAFEVGVGNGTGDFNWQGGTAPNQSDGIDKAVRRLMHAYSSCLAGTGLSEDDLAGHIRKAVTP